MAVVTAGAATVAAVIAAVDMVAAGVVVTPMAQRIPRRTIPVPATAVHTDIVPPHITILVVAVVPIVGQEEIVDRVAATADTVVIAVADALRVLATALPAKW